VLAGSTVTAGPGRIREADRIGIETSDLTKRFGRGSLLTRIAGRAARRESVTALDGVTVSVAAGDVCALVGHNGSGKSTMLRVLASLVLPDGGSARVAGHDVVADDVAVRRRTALVVADDRSFSLRLTGRENLEFFAGLHGAPHAAVGESLTRVALDDAADDVYATYSSGMRQRLALARGLLGQPSVLLLDEPFRALDEVSSDSLRGVIADATSEGITVLVATHHTDELAGLCDQVVELVDGRVTYDGDLPGWRPAREYR
jgi:ABC-2 type transport system ATP-binding protein